MPLTFAALFRISELVSLNLDSPGLIDHEFLLWLENNNFSKRIMLTKLNPYHTEFLLTDGRKTYVCIDLQSYCVAAHHQKPYLEAGHSKSRACVVAFHCQPISQTRESIVRRPTVVARGP